MSDPIYVQGSNEFKSFTITQDGATVTTGVSFSVVTEAPNAHPGTFTAAATLGGKVGFYLAAYAVGCWRVFAKVDTGAEQPEIDCGLFYIK